MRKTEDRLLSLNELEARAGRQASGIPARRRPRYTVSSRSAKYRGLPQVQYSRKRAKELNSGLILMPSAKAALAGPSSPYRLLDMAQ